MSSTTFSISEALSFGWKTFKSNYKFWIIALILSASVGFMNGANYHRDSSRSQKIEQQVTTKTTTTSVRDDSGSPTTYSQTTSTSENSENPPVWLVITGVIFGLPFILLMMAVGLLVFVVNNCINMGYLKLNLDAVRGLSLKYETLVSMIDLRRSLKFLVASLLYGIMVGFGFFFFIIPGIYFMTKYAYYAYGFVDKGLGIFDSFKYSAKLTSGIKLQLMGYFIVCVGVFIVGFFCLFVGIIPAMIVINLATAYIYEQVRKQVEENIVPAN